MKKEIARERAEKWLKSRNESDYVAGGSYKRELMYYTWYLETHCKDGEDDARAILDATEGREMYAFALANPVENKEFEMVFGKGNPETEARAYYKLAVKNYVINYYKYSEDGFCDEGKISKTFDDVWVAAEDMIRDTMQHYSVDKMAKQIRRLANLAGDAAYEARMNEKKHAEMLDSMGWVRTDKPATMTAAQFLDRYNPKKTTDGKIKIQLIDYDKNERDAIKIYIDHNREQIRAELDRREKISAEVHEMYKNFKKGQK